MRNKSYIFFTIVLIFSPLFSDAATIFTDDLNGYSKESLSGQGNWQTGGGNVQIQDYWFYEGRGVLMSNYVSNPYFAEKSGQTVNDGQITIYIRRTIGGTTNPDLEVQLKEGDDVKVSMKSNGYQFRYFDRDYKYQYVKFGPGFASNVWYALQIQWRSSDHKARYSIDGGVWTEWALGVTDWSEGLNKVKIIGQNGSTFFDTIGKNIFGVVEKNPILIVPGIMGTELKKGEELLWADVPRMLLDKGDEFMDDLSFNGDLTPSNIDVYNNEVIKNPSNLFDYTEGLINEFKGQDYRENENLFLFPYDWRYGVSGKYADPSNPSGQATNVDLLKEKIDEILKQTYADKVDVIAHSNGGLLVKKYVMDNFTEDPATHKINKAVFVGVPNTGAPKAVKALIQGDNMDISFAGLGLSESEMKKISQNMPVAYDLLPSQKYYDTKGSFVKVIDEGDFGNFTDDTIKDLNFQESKSFLIEKGINQQAKNMSEDLHTADFDNYDLRTAGVNVYNIAGCKTATFSKMVERRFKNIFGQSFTEYQRPDYSFGDGTVPIESATNLPVDQKNKYYAINTKHSSLLSKDGARQQIVNLILNTNLAVDENVVTQDIDKCQLNGKAISIFSPVNIFITDQFGNRLGFGDEGDIINEIAGASFEILGDPTFANASADKHKFVFLPTDAGQIYTINLTGTGQGTFTLKAEDIQNNQTTKTEVFSNLPVTLELTGKINISETENTSLVLKQTPSSDEKTVLADSVLTTEQSNDYLPPVSIVTLTGEKNENGIYTTEVKIKIQSADNEGGSGILNLRYKLDNTDYIKLSADPSANSGQVNAGFEASAEGKYTVLFYATDNAGNNEQEQEIEFEIKFPEPEPEPEPAPEPEPEAVLAPETPDPVPDPVLEPVVEAPIVQSTPVAVSSGGGGLNIESWMGNLAKEPDKKTEDKEPILIQEPVLIPEPVLAQEPVYTQIIQTVTPEDKPIMAIKILEPEAKKIVKTNNTQITQSPQTAQNIETSNVKKDITQNDLQSDSNQDKKENLFLASINNLGNWVFGLLGKIARIFGK